MSSFPIGSSEYSWKAGCPAVGPGCGGRGLLPIRDDSEAERSGLALVLVIFSCHSDQIPDSDSLRKARLVLFPSLRLPRVVACPRAVELNVLAVGKGRGGVCPLPGK